MIHLSRRTRSSSHQMLHMAHLSHLQVVYTQTGTNKPNLEKGIREALGASKLPQDWVYPPEEEQA
jgi:hypothetical protein